MKRFLRNFRTVDDVMDTLCWGILTAIIKILNAIQYTKMYYYKIRQIPCYMTRDYKFGEITCNRKKEDETKT